MTHKITLPSGAELEITEAPFRIAEALNDALMEECGALQAQLSSEIDVKALLSRVVLKGFSSKKIKAAVWDCMARATYKGVKITQDTWEPTEARADYYVTCYHVAEVNVRPFMKDLSAQFEPIVKTLTKSFLG